MKKLTISRTLIALVVLGAIGSFVHVTRVKAFTLIELQYLPFLELVPAQQADISVSNVTANAVDVVITIYGGNGTVLSTKSVTLLPFATFNQVVKAPATGSLGFRTTISLGTASATVSDVVTFDKTTGEAMSVAQGLLLPAVQ